MPNNIEFAKRYTTIIDEVYQRSSVSGCLNSPRRMVREGRNAKEILIPKISVTGLGDYTRNFYGQSPFGSKKVSEDNGI